MSQRQIYFLLVEADRGSIGNNLRILRSDPNLWSGRALQEVSSIWVHGLTIHQNFPSIFIDRVTRRVIQRVCPNQRVEMCRYGWWDRGGCRVGLG